jgi:hypothetical protein
MIGVKCKSGHRMSLVDVQLESYGGPARYEPLRGYGAGIRVVKSFRCPVCGEESAVREEVR